MPKLTPNFQATALQARRFNRGGNGTWVFYIKCINATTDFQMSVASTAGGFTIDDIKLEEIQDGDLFANGGLKVRDGDNATIGTAQLTAGIVTVNTNKVTANSIILLTNQSGTTNAGELTVSARSAGASFNITSTNSSDANTIGWMIVEPIT